MNWLRRLFFKDVKTIVEPEPLAVDWPAGEAVIAVEYVAALAAWCMPNADGSMPMMGLRDQATIELKTRFERPVTAFSWLDAPKMAKIKSVKIDGVEMLAGEAPGAMFSPHPRTLEAPRMWWGWILWPLGWMAKLMMPLVERATRPLVRAMGMYAFYRSWRR